MDMSIPVSLNLTPAQINEAISKAVLESKLGAEINRIVQEKLNKIRSDSWNNPLDAVIENEIKAIARNIIISDFSQTLREALKTKLNEKVTNDFVAKMWEKIDRGY